MAPRNIYEASMQRKRQMSRPALPTTFLAFQTNSICHRSWRQSHEISIARR